MLHSSSHKWRNPWRYLSNKPAGVFQHAPTWAHASTVSKGEEALLGLFQLLRGAFKPPLRAEVVSIIAPVLDISVQSVGRNGKHLTLLDLMLCREPFLRTQHRDACKPTYKISLHMLSRPASIPLRIGTQHFASPNVDVMC